MKAVNKKLGLLAICAGALTLVACGGDSATVPLTLRGVAATGLAIDGGSVVVQCVSGTGTATTLANGSYSVTVQNGQGPCLITVTKGSVVLRSISPQTTSGTAVANVTPFSNAIVNSIVAAKGAGSPAALVTGGSFVPSNSDLTSAVTAVIVQINEALAALPTPIAPLSLTTDLLGQVDYVAATVSSPSSGDLLDKAIDALVQGDGVTLPPALVADINTATDTVVDPTPTGGTGGF
ncbi:hypothetical protein [Limnohabitans sp. 2KL-3]|uniref:hypothetical protein n=1 Tax=Limnohabitans sp. 2KL-3 TaxID=1100700 RepID=UPI000AB7B2DC|nr:hypothetical protein [Limnohabitans sp. 2KL-3]